MTAGLRIDDPAYFDRLAEVEARHWWSLGVWRLASYWLDCALPGRSGLRVLDVGCGTGLTARRLALRPDVAEVVGLDPSPDALRHAGARFDGRLTLGSALALPFPDGRFDVVTGFDVLQHLPPGGDLVAAAEMRRVLRPAGVALVRSNGRGFTGGASAYRLADLVGLFARAGFRVGRASYANALPALAQEVRGLLSRGNGSASGHPSGGGLRIRMPRPAVNRLMAGVAVSEAWAAGRLGVRLPFGHSTMLLAVADGDAGLAVTGPPVCGLVGPRPRGRVGGPTQTGGYGGQRR